MTSASYTNEHLAELAERHAAIGDIRGDGLFKAVELVNDRQTREPATDLAGRVVEGLRKRRVLTGRIGKDNNVLKLRPPMVFSRENADYFVGILDDVLADAS